jgi:uncharacterized protein YbjQ (UPF0145 family)
MTQLITVLVILAVGFCAGKFFEIRHIRRLKEREQELSSIMINNLRSFQGVDAKQAFLVLGSAVIATDYFKTFVSGFRNIFGGEMKAYRSLMGRARREALVRLLEQAHAAGADSVWNLRYETSTIQGKKRAGGVEILAYATAVKNR